MQMTQLASGWKLQPAFCGLWFQFHFYFWSLWSTFWIDPLTVALTLLHTGELIRERNHIDVMNVGKHLMRVLPLLYIWEIILEKNPTNVIIVRKLSVRILLLLFIRECIVERNALYAATAEKPLVVTQPYFNTREITVKRNSVNWIDERLFFCCTFDNTLKEIPISIIKRNLLVRV